jgi:predicted metal-dependent hydrolase
MTETIQLGNISIQVTRKAIKHVHLSVHPPSGRVTLSAPRATRLDVARAYAISKLGWIREQRRRFALQAREAPRRFVERESHDLWGRRHLLTVIYRDTKPFVSLDHKRITLIVRPGSDAGMKTKWGSCNHKAGHIRLNTELAKKPKDLLEYVVVHEMAHLIEPRHSERFIEILEEHYPTWREARSELNELPLTAEAWKE